MPGEPQGPTYTAPPSIVSPVDGERTRSIEDFLSRRIKVMTQTTSDFPITTTTRTAVPLGAAVYDTSGLYNGTNKFIIPKGAEGDYLIIATIDTDPVDMQESLIFVSGPEESYARVLVDPGSLGTTYQVIATHTLYAGSEVELRARRLSTTEEPTILAGSRFEMRRLA